MKTTNKFFVLLFSGLFLLTAPGFSFAEGTSEDLHGKDAWTYLNENVTKSEYEEFTKAYGKSAKEKPINVIECGTRRCNLEISVCLYKESRGWIRDTANTLLAFNLLTTAFVDATSTTNYEYVCLLQTEESSINTYKKDGWKEVELDENGEHTNLRRKSKKILDGDTKEVKEKVKECYTAVSGGETKKYCVKMIGDNIEIKSANAKGRGCDVVSVKLYNDRKCAFCSMIGVVYAVSNRMTAVSRNKFAYSFAVVIVIGMAIWIAMKTLLFVSSMTKQDAAKYITEMLKQSYKFMIAFFALIYFDNVYIYIINPLLNAGLNFGSEFINAVPLENRFGVKTIEELKVLVKDSNEYFDYKRNLENAYYSFDTYAKLENFAYSVNERYALLQTIGSVLNCLGRKYMWGLLGEDGWAFGLGLDCIIYGIAFSVFGFFLSIAFVFYLFDSIVQLGIVGALLPFLIASWPFKITSKYTSTGFKMLLNSIFTFMMMGLIVKISMELIGEALKFNIVQQAENDGKVAENMGGGLAELIAAMDTIDTEKLKEMVNVISIGFLLFLFANIMGFLLLGRVSELVNRFASGGMKGAAPSIATMGASAIKGAAKKVARPTTKAVGEWAEDKAEKFTKWSVDKVVGGITLRPLRRRLEQKISTKFNKKFGTTDEERETAKRREVETARQSMGAEESQTGGSGGNSDNPKKVILGNGSKTEARQTSTPEGNEPETNSDNPSSVTEPKSTQSETENPSTGSKKSGKKVVIGNGRRPSKKSLDNLD